MWPCSERTEPCFPVGKYPDPRHDLTLVTAGLRGVAGEQRGARKRRAHQLMQIPVRHGAHPLEAIELDVIRGARRRPERCGPDTYRVRHLAMSLLHPSSCRFSSFLSFGASLSWSYAGFSPICRLVFLNQPVIFLIGGMRGSR